MKRSPISRTVTPWEDKRQDRKQRADDPITPDVRAVVRNRSGGLCELGCGSPSSHLHHRQRRALGRHTASNLVDLCSFCHQRLHSRVRWAMDVGFIVSAYQDPALVEILRHNDWVILTDAGTLVAK